MEKRVTLKTKIVLAALFWGAVLAIGGVLYGNQSPLVPDFKSFEETVLQEKLQQETLNCWITHQRADFRLIEFAKANACSQQFSGLEAYACYPEHYLNSPKWLRSAFQNSDKQLIVFADTQEKSSYAAARLTYYGNKARMLEREATVGNAQPQPVLPKAQTVVKPVVQPKQPVLAPVAQSKATPVEQNEDEGC